jgi:hypothetical protein
MRTKPWDGGSGVVMFGGATGTGPISETWTWDPTLFWQECLTTVCDPTAIPPTAPTGRSSASADFENNATQQKVVLFGGAGATFSDTHDDTWFWQGINSGWTLCDPAAQCANRPSARSGQRMAFDVATGKSVMFGGFNGPTLLNDTWYWNGAGWCGPTGTPTCPTNPGTLTARCCVGFDYYGDGVTRPILFGGGNNDLAPSLVSLLGDTWALEDPIATWVCRLLC